jgi:hypothetical protein
VIPAEIRLRLAKTLHDIDAATALLHAHGITWAQVMASPVAARRPPPPNAPWREQVAYCRRYPAPLSPFDLALLNYLEGLPESKIRLDKKRRGQLMRCRGKAIAEAVA